jgi:hypothetical protein
MRLLTTRMLLTEAGADEPALRHEERDDLARIVLARNLCARLPRGAGLA